jgi:hypothetical protein
MSKFCDRWLKELTLLVNLTRPHGAEMFGQTLFCISVGVILNELNL